MILVFTLSSLLYKTSIFEIRLKITLHPLLNVKKIY